MRTLFVLSLTTLLSANLLALDLKCFGEVETPESSKATLTLHINEKIVGTLYSTEDIFSIGGQYVYGSQDVITIMDGKVNIIKRANAIVKPILAGIVSKQLVGFNTSEGIDSYKFRGLVNAKLDDYLEIDRFNQTAKLFLAGPTGNYKIVDCK